MYALGALLTGLAIAHGMWAYFYLCGTVLRTPRIAPEYDAASFSPGRAALEIVVSTASGIAITAFLTFFLGIAHALYPLTAALWLIALATAFAVLGDSPLRPAFWQRRFALVRRAAVWPMIVVYVLALVLAVPAILPDPGSDATALYWAYALDWANAHGLLVDYWLRFPYYAYNWALLDVWMIEFGAIAWMNFLGWLAACLSMLAICASVLAFAPSRLSGSWKAALALIAPLCLLLSPGFLHWVDNGMIDIPTGLFFLVSAAAALATLRFRDRSLLLDLALCAGFFAGLKISLFAFIPAWCACAVAGLAVTRSSARFSRVVLSLLVALSLPWYAKNFVQDGDPIAPVLNLAIHGVDRKWSKSDMAIQMGDLTVGTSRVDMLRIPVDIVTKTTSHAFREPGVTWILFFVWVPGAVVIFMLLRRSWRGSPTFLVNALLLYAIAYWLATSHVARYALLFVPAAAATAGAAAGWAVVLARPFRFAAAALLLFCALPTPGSAAWLENFGATYYGAIWSGYTNREQSLLARSVAYPEIVYVGRALSRARMHGAHVYALNLEFIHFFAIEHGFVSIGDWFGPERYRDFKAAIEEQSLPAYVQRFDIRAFIIPTPPFLVATRNSPDAADVVAFDRQIRAMGFVKVWRPDWHYVVYLGPGVR